MLSVVFVEGKDIVLLIDSKISFEVFSSERIFGQFSAQCVMHSTMSKVKKFRSDYDILFFNDVTSTFILTANFAIIIFGKFGLAKVINCPKLDNWMSISRADLTTTSIPSIFERDNVSYVNTLNISFFCSFLLHVFFNY